MMENFISHIKVENSRNVKDFEIPLDKEKRTHLILTGKNGSGKTSLLLKINEHLTKMYSGEIVHLTNLKRTLSRTLAELDNKELTPFHSEALLKNVKSIKDQISLQYGVNFEFSSEDNIIYQKIQSGEFILAFFDAKRHIQLNIPKGVSKVQLLKKYKLGDRANTNFIQYIVNLKADRSFARDDNEMDVVKKIDLWFTALEERLRIMFDVRNLQLRFDRKLYNFDIIADNNSPITFTNLSDGYSAIVSIITEILLRMEAYEVKAYDMEGVVIIDEIETHLHVDLQKKILPFLIDFFPKIQFIVTTHSPFVLSSIENAIICDLEKKIVTSDLSGYSYDTLIESYFESDKYSNELKEKVNVFEILMSKEDLSEKEKETLTELKRYLNEIPKFVSDELAVKLQQIKLVNLGKKN